MSSLVGCLKKVSNAGYRYWRLLADDDAYYTSDGVNYNSIIELQLFSSVNATGVDLTAGSQMSASSENTSNYNAYKAVDDSIATRWATFPNQVIRSWIKSTLSAAAAIHSLTISGYMVGPNTCLAKKYLLQWSADGSSNWTTLATIFPANVSGVQTFTNL